jgi:long-chain acyl-CoA synthetase
MRDCAVFGIPDEEFGEQICAHVEPLPDAPIDAMDVRSYLGQHLARYKLPKVVELSASLPREDSGKIFKRKLRAPCWEKVGRSI